MTSCGCFSEWNLQPPEAGLVSYPPGRLSCFDVSRYGALGDGSHDDTSSIQTAIDAAELVNGSVYIPAGLYKITDTLTIDSPITFFGDNVSACWGLMDEAESRIIGIEIPTKAPYLKGSVILQTTAAKDAIKITVAGDAVHLHDFGIRFSDAIRFSNTGHGINCLPPVNAIDNPQREFGIFDSHWENVFVWGHDGDHYAFTITNPVLPTFNNLRGFGGGGLEMHANCDMTAPGNGVIIHPYFALFAGGTAHGIYIHTTGLAQGCILNVFIRPQVNALNGPAAWGLTSLDEVNQYRWYADAKSLKTMLIAPDFENYLVNCPTTLSANNGMDGFNMIGNQAGGTAGTKLSNANIDGNGLVLNADNGSITAELLPSGAVVKSPNGNFWKIKVANDGTISSEAL